MGRAAFEQQFKELQAVEHTDYYAAIYALQAFILRAELAGLRGVFHGTVKGNRVVSTAD